MASTKTRVPPYCAFVQRLPAHSDDGVSAFMTMTTYHDPVMVDPAEAEVVLIALARNRNSRALQAAIDNAVDGYLFRIQNAEIASELTRLAEYLFDEHAPRYVAVLGRRYMSLSDMLRTAVSETVARERTKQMQLEVERLRLELEIARLRLELAKVSLPVAL